MPVATNWGPPSIAGSINEGVDSILGGIKDYRTGQLLESLPKTADGSVDYRAAAIAMSRVNPALAAQFLKMEELRGLQDYRKEALRLQERGLDIQGDKGGTTLVEGKQVTRDARGNITSIYDPDTNTYLPLPGRPGQAPASPQVQTPQYKQPTPEHIELLKANPSLAPKFDDPKAYGPGASARILNPAGATTTTPAPAAPQAPVQAPAAPHPALKRMPGESYDVFKERTKKLAGELGNIDQAKLKEADDALNTGRSTIRDYVTMQRLNETALGSFAAGPRGWLAARTGIGGKQAGEDTRVLENMLQSIALQQLKPTFGAAPTEGERKILLQIQGSINDTPEQRRVLLQRGAEIARRHFIYNQKYANAVRAGNQHLMPAYTDNLPLD